VSLAAWAYRGQLCAKIRTLEIDKHSFQSRSLLRQCAASRNVPGLANRRTRRVFFVWASWRLFFNSCEGQRNCEPEDEATLRGDTLRKQDVGEVARLPTPPLAFEKRLSMERKKNQKVIHIHCPKTDAKRDLTPDNCVVALIDHQPQMLFASSNFDRQSIQKQARWHSRRLPQGFDVPSCSRRWRRKACSGNMWPQIKAGFFPKKETIARNRRNSW